MNNENFCFWMQGYCELVGDQPTANQWKLIIEHLTLAQTCDKSGFYNYDHFVDTLQGFLDINGPNVSHQQWSTICETLQNCFNKVTSNVKEQHVPFITPEDIGEILGNVAREQQGQTIPQPFTPKCDGGKAFCGSLNTEKACCGDLDKAYDSQNDGSVFDR